MQLLWTAPRGWAATLEPGGPAQLPPGQGEAQPCGGPPAPHGTLCARRAEQEPKGRRDGDPAWEARGGTGPVPGGPWLLRAQASKAAAGTTSSLRSRPPLFCTTRTLVLPRRKAIISIPFYPYYFLAVLGLNSGPCACKSGTLSPSHSPSPLRLNYFSDRVSRFCLVQVLDLDPPIYTSCIAGMTGVRHHAQLAC
jgi:hypothetical protein